MLRQRLIRHYATGLAPTVRQLLAHPPAENTEVSARGHIKSIRSFKNIGFLDIADGTSAQLLNVVFSNPEEVLAQKFKVGQSVVVRGKWSASQGTQKHELQYDASNSSHGLTIAGDVPESYPMQKKSHSLQFLRSLPTLRHRTSMLASVLRFRSRVESLLVNYFQENDFTKVAPPLLTAADCEGAGEQFAVEPLHGKPEEKFFSRDVYLTVSSQLHLEVLALSLNRVWTLSPCFRAEDSNTNRHLSEFYMLEAEICHVEQLLQLTDFVEDMIRSTVKNLQNEDLLHAGSMTDLTDSRYSKEERAEIHKRWDQVLGNEWPSITYAEALDTINKIKNKGRLKGRLQWGDSILTEQEKWLAGTHFQSPVFVTDYPREQKPFYMPLSATHDPERPTVACFDLLVPDIGELIGGSLREHSYEKLLSEMEHRGMKTEPMQWYLLTRENGSVPHGGFGMGFERFIAYLGAVDSIRDVSAFPRAPQTCAC